MKYIFTFLLIVNGVLAKAQFQDNFTDGDFTNNPIWIGMDTNFEINATNQLHLNAPSVSDESYLVVETQAAIDGYWEFYIDLQFNPSAANKAFVYLISDQQDLKGSLNGYYVLVGNTSDEVSLYKQTGNSSSKIIDGIDGTVAISPKVKIKVTRDVIGNFELLIDTSNSLTNYESQGVVFDDDFIESNYFGVLCDYTATRSDKFIFDDFNITAQEFIDVFPPNITTYEIVNQYSIKLFFSEELNTSTAENNTNYLVDNSISNPINAVYDYLEKSVLLSFADNFIESINYNLTISNIQDLNNNVLNTTIPFQIQNAYSFNTIVFNEILADETPFYGLPTYEFIEFKNLQNDTLFTEGWFLSDFTDTAFFDIDTILPNELVIVGKTTAETYYEGFGKTFGLSNFISLNKSEDKLTLFNKYGNVIDSLHYFEEWFRDNLAPNNEHKVDGGWTLERAFDTFDCSASYNWYPSVGNLGGTPGSENSIHNIILDNTLPEILFASILNDTTIKIVFDNDVTNALDKSIYSIEIIDYDMILIYTISNINFENGAYFLTVTEKFIKNDALLQINGLENCFEVFIDIGLNLFTIKDIEFGDIVINEILFNPFTGAEDYLEIYNTTNFALNLKNIQIVEYDVFEEYTITDFSTKFNTDFIIEPYSYLVFSVDTQTVLSNYIVSNKKWLHQLNIPSFADNEGIVALTLNDSVVLDKLHYFSRWNFELLDSEDGVSLERINSKNATQNNNNWASAAKSFGYGTPTAKNSQSFDQINQEDLIKVVPEVFTPNQDGFNDFAIINYKIDKPGYVANVSVFDLKGRKIKDLALNETIGIEGFWKWDGTTIYNEKAKIGIYIILIELFDIKGNKKHFKEKVVLGTQL